MRIAALSAGGQAPRGRFNGVVHSVFREACNILLDDGRMLTLLAPHLGNLPHGVRLDAPAGFDFARQVGHGQRVGCRADVLRIPGALSIDLATAQPWRGELPVEGVDLSDPSVTAAWRAVWHALHRGPTGAGRDLGLPPRVVDGQGMHLAHAVRAQQADAAARAVDGLIGCGPGLTPSGDDLIVGLLAGLWCTAGDRPARRTLLDVLCRAVALAAEATGEISRVYLMHATRGCCAEALVTLVQCIGAGANRRDIQAAIAAALRVGHTSGGDGAFGLLLGLAAWAPRSALPLRRPTGISPPASPAKEFHRPLAGARRVAPGSAPTGAPRRSPDRAYGRTPARSRPSMDGGADPAAPDITGAGDAPHQGR